MLANINLENVGLFKHHYKPDHHPESILYLILLKASDIHMQIFHTQGCSIIADPSNTG